MSAILTLACLLVAAADGSTLAERADGTTIAGVRIVRPSGGSFVTAGMKTLLDLRVLREGENMTTAVPGYLPPDTVVCLASGTDAPEALVGSGHEQCFGDTNPRFLVTGVGEHRLRAYLRSEPSAGGADAGRVLTVSEPVAFSSGSSSVCNASNFGRLPCMITRPSCGRFLKFRFFLYPATGLPSAHAAAVYLELAKSPLRTEDPFAACVYIAVGDVRSNNVVRESPEVGAVRRSRLQLWGSGENHIVFNYGDYGPGIDLGRAILAASSFGPPLDVEWLRARGNVRDVDTLPSMVQERKGFDIVMPLPFYRCNMGGDYVHLNKYASGSAAALAARVPSERPFLLTFKGAAYEFSPGHPSEPRITLRRVLHNGRDIHVALTCWGLSPSCEACEPPACTSPPLVNTTSARYPECAEWTREAGAKYDYDELILSSRFAAIIPGEGTHSYRLYEAMQAGAIPVLMGHSARPLEPLIKWSDVAIIQEDTSEAGLRYLEAQLRHMSPDVTRRMQARGRTVFNAHFKDLGAQLHSMFALLAPRFDVVIKAAHAEAEEKAAAAKLVSAGLSPAGDLLAVAGGNSSTDSAAAAVSVGALMASPPLDTSGSLSSLVPDAKAPAPPPARDLEKAMDVRGVVGGSMPPPSSLTASDGVQFLSTGDRPAPISDAPSPLGSNPIDTHAHFLAAGYVAAQRAAQLLGAVSSRISTTLLGGGVADHVEGASVLDHLSGTQAASAFAELSTAVNAWLSWLQLAVPDPRVRTTLPAERTSVSQVYSMLSQAYSAAGEWRHAATASHSVLLQLGPERTQAAQASDTRRIRNANSDARRRVQPPAQLEQQRRSALLLHRLVEDAQPAYDMPLPPAATTGALLSAPPPPVTSSPPILVGYGALAHFMGPQPLGSLGAPSIALPVDLSVGSLLLNLPSLRGSVGPTSHVLVTETTLRAVASLIAHSDRPLGGVSGTPAPMSLSSFRKTHNIPLVPTTAKVASSPADTYTPQQLALAKSIGRVAVVSLCAYEASKTNLTSISAANLKAFCNTHDYECFLATESLDTARPTAWTKVLLVAAVLPRFDWVMWRDCDSFFMDKATTVETLIAAARTARAVTAAATARALSGSGALAHLHAEALRSPVNHSSSEGGVTPPTCPDWLATPSSAVASSAGASRVLPLGGGSLDLVISEDGFMLNTGVWVVRNTRWGRGWLRRMYGETDVRMGGVGGGVGGGVAASTVAPFGSELLASLLQQEGGEGSVGGGGSDEGVLSRQLRALQGLGGASHPLGSAADLRASGAARVAAAAMEAADAAAGLIPLGANANGVLATEGNDPTGDAVLLALRKPVLREALGPAILNSRMWEQGTALLHLALRGASLQQSGSGSMRSLTADAGMFSLPPMPPHGEGMCRGVTPWADVLHTQFVPQQWLNSYPDSIARQLLDVTQGMVGETAQLPSLHAAFEAGDWVVSFSGCAVYFGAERCEGLFAEWGGK